MGAQQPRLCRRCGPVAWHRERPDGALGHQIVNRGFRRDDAEIGFRRADDGNVTA